MLYASHDIIHWPVVNDDSTQPMIFYTYIVNIIINVYCLFSRRAYIEFIVVCRFRVKIQFVSENVSPQFKRKTKQIPINKTVGFSLSPLLALLSLFLSTNRIEYTEEWKDTDILQGILVIGAYFILQNVGKPLVTSA